MSPVMKDQHIIKVPEEEVECDKRGLGYNLFLSMQKHKNCLAQIDAVTGQEKYYKTLLQQCIRTAIRMKQIGVTENDVISICSFNRMESVVPFVAATFLGVKLANLDPRLSKPYAKELVEIINPKLVFADESGINLLKEVGAPMNIVSFDKTIGYENFDNYLVPQEDEERFKPFEVKNEMETAAVLFTSGTTGVPKGVCLNHYSLVRRCYNVHSSSDIAMFFSPLYWIGSYINFLSVLLNGSCNIVTPKFDPVETWQNISKYRVTYLFVTTAQAIAMSKAKRPKYLDTSKFSRFSFGSSLMPEHILKELRRILPNTRICASYGQTEATGAVTSFDFNAPEDMRLFEMKPTSCGKPMDGFWYKVADLESGEALGPYKHGELKVKSKFCLNGYYKNDYCDVFDSEGWLKTGDLVYYDEDYCFYIVDRLKETFKYLDWRIAPSNIERILQTHPAVQSCAVLGVPHEDDISHALGIVVLDENHENIRPEELVEHVNSRADEKYHIRAGVKIVKSIPLTRTGKIDRKNLKQLVSSEKI